MGDLFGLFAGIAILIACLGLFGLASFTAEVKTKEIGIRKVLGSKVSSIVILLAKDFVKWIIIANLKSWPIAYYFMRKWILNFAFRIDLSPDIFIMSFLLALFIATLTISFQTVKAATANPVKSLRYE